MYTGITLATTAISDFAVIGAGISGVVAAAHLLKEGLDVTVFERSSVAGGVCPCYVGLQNNVATRMLRTTLNSFPPGTPDVVSHSVLAAYIRDTSIKTGVHDVTKYNTSVQNLKKEGDHWTLDATSLEKQPSGSLSWTKHSSYFTDIVVASGHYHDPRVPNIPNLSTWKTYWPMRIQHSKSYRNPSPFANKTVLLIGASVSSTDIARELGPVAHRVYQTHRNGAFDLPATMLPSNAFRVDDVAAFDAIPDSFDARELRPDDPLPFNVTLTSGRTLCGIHHVILCTGYHITLPFLSSYCSPNPRGGVVVVDDTHDEITDTTLVTDGIQIHNLHKDIFYIPDPSLVFIGVPYFTATFTLFEFQAMIAAKVVAGKVKLPREDEMRSEYAEKVAAKGLGKGFHSLRGEEEAYVDGLVAWANRDLERGGWGVEERLRGHTEGWREAKVELVERMKGLLEGAGVVREIEVRC
ncbi:dimethylaniline monooxygenase [Periconia macrospinosa]|uniref:Dimethylaniline monooxygenase n=1 Tax=Periconia macrospinosa TaxID=97972 RepID=A0A2V1DSS3_9PLEO|nr:dimethylaniline monooxygenase [Periconia macrospinosa]